MSRSSLALAVEVGEVEADPVLRRRRPAASRRRRGRRGSLKVLMVTMPSTSSISWRASGRTLSIAARIHSRSRGVTVASKRERGGADRGVDGAARRRRSRRVRPPRRRRAGAGRGGSPCACVIGGRVRGLKAGYAGRHEQHLRGSQGPRRALGSARRGLVRRARRQGTPRLPGRVRGLHAGRVRPDRPHAVADGDRRDLQRRHRRHRRAVDGHPVGLGDRRHPRRRARRPDRPRAHADAQRRRLLALHVPLGPGLELRDADGLPRLPGHRLRRRVGRRRGAGGRAGARRSRAARRSASSRARGRSAGRWPWSRT